MPLFNVYLKDPNTNPFVLNPTRPVFKGLSAGSKEEIRKHWKDFSEETEEFKGMEIDEIIEVAEE